MFNDIVGIIIIYIHLKKKSRKNELANIINNSYVNRIVFVKKLIWFLIIKNFYFSLNIQKSYEYMLKSKTRLSILNNYCCCSSAYTLFTIGLA